VKTPVWQVRGWLRSVGRLLQTRGPAALKAVSPNLVEMWFDGRQAKYQPLAPSCLHHVSEKNRTGKFSDNSFESSMHLRNFLTVIKRTKSVRDRSWHCSPHLTHVAAIPCENKLQKLMQILFRIQRNSRDIHIETLSSIISWKTPVFASSLVSWDFPAPLPWSGNTVYAHNTNQKSKSNQTIL